MCCPGGCGGSQSAQRPAATTAFGQAYSTVETRATGYVGGNNLPVQFNTFTPLRRVGQGENSLVVQRSGMYEISYNASLSHQFGNTILSVFVAEDGTPIPATRSEWWAMPTAHVDAASKTALAYLESGTVLTLLVHAGQSGELIVSPFASLVIRRIDN